MKGAYMKVSVYGAILLRPAMHVNARLHHSERRGAWCLVRPSSACSHARTLCAQYAFLSSTMGQSYKVDVGSVDPSSSRFMAVDIKVQQAAAAAAASAASAAAEAAASAPVAAAAATA